MQALEGKEDQEKEVYYTTMVSDLARENLMGVSEIRT